MIIKAPNPIPAANWRKRVFLAGAIDMGKAVNWQHSAQNVLDAPDVLIMNPRRDDWDSSWTQEMSDPQFFEQVNWELDCLDNSDIVLVVFTETSKAPITFMEFGLNIDKAIVCVEPGFYRKGNIDIVCDRYSVPKFEDLQDALDYTRKVIDQ